MSAERPRTAKEMVAWLKAHPEEPFFCIDSADRIVIGTRNDDGELNGYVCTVTDREWQLDRRKTSGGR